MTFQLHVDSVSKNYQEVHGAVDSINFKVATSEKIGIVGGTGSGKSTILRIIAGLEKADTGKVYYEGEPVKGPDEQLIPGHKEIIYLSQHADLPKFITVEEYLDNAYHINDEQAQLINEACKVAHLLEKDTSELSGGEKQRVSFAKALTLTPKVLLLDEPFSNLDKGHKMALKEVIDQISNQLKTTILMVTHDASDVLPWADRVFVLKEGSIIQAGVPMELYHQPDSEYVALLFGIYSLLPRDEYSAYHNVSRHLIDDKLFLRPEDLELNGKAKSNSIYGTVQKCEYLGAYHLITATTLKQTILRVISNQELRPGEVIYLSLKP